MTSKIKHLIVSKIVNSWKNYGVVHNLDSKLLPLLSIGNSTEKETNIHLSINILKYKITDFNENHVKSILDISADKKILSVKKDVGYNKEPILSFNVDNIFLTQEILTDDKYFENFINPTLAKGQKVVIDYSSPNIAKPFHVGHLRSTIIGNFIANLYSFLSYDVTRLTYIGDWGTQFGVLHLGLKHLNPTDEELKQTPIELLFKAYVEGNKLSEADPTVADEARRVFQLLETENANEEMEKWQKCKQYTVDELARTYSRLGVTFDEYDWESMYRAKNILPVLEEIRARGIVENDDGKEVIQLGSGRSAILLKSDGSTLYLTRDIAAALDRYNKHKFSHMLYVVDSSQAEHFVSLKNIASAIGWNWAEGLQHVKFGRIKGMSTRKGQVVFLKDILDEIKEIMQQKQLESPTTKAGVTEETADILGISAVIINDLKQKRTKDYIFNWSTALQTDGDSGVKLQYTHCRLVNLEKNCGVSLPDHCDPTLLLEAEARALVNEIARFDEILLRSHSQLESSILVRYLFRLCNTVSKALKTLNIKHEQNDIGQQRLLLFYRTRIVLYRGMKILGLQPLEKM